MCDYFPRTRPTALLSAKKAPPGLNRMGPYQARHDLGLLKLVLEPELDRTTAVNRCSHGVVLIADQVIARSKKVRMVEGIEKFSAKLNRLIFQFSPGNGKPPANARVEVPLARTVN